MDDENSDADDEDGDAGDENDNVDADATTFCLMAIHNCGEALALSACKVILPLGSAVLD